MRVLNLINSLFCRNKDIRNIQQSIQKDFQEQIQQITNDTQQIVQGYSNLIDYLKRYELTVKEEMIEAEIGTSATRLTSSESWAGYFKRKTIAVWKYCTFQKPEIKLAQDQIIK